MTFGKREQIVVGVVAAIALIALLHLLIFQGAMQDLAQAKTNRDLTAGQIAGSKTVGENTQLLVQYKDKTDRYITELKNGIKALKLEQPKEFAVIPIEEIKDEDITMPANLKPEE